MSHEKLYFKIFHLKWISLERVGEYFYGEMTFPFILSYTFELNRQAMQLIRHTFYPRSTETLMLA